jgi:hypothetical protein
MSLSKKENTNVTSPQNNEPKLEDELKKQQLSLPMQAPWEVTIDIKPIPLLPLSGEFLIQTHLKGRYLTAVGGGGKASDAIHTDATQPRAWEKFRLWVDAQTTQYYALQTVNGHFLTANNGGGLISNAIQSTVTVLINGWGLFKLIPQSPFPSYAIQTIRGYFLTAVGGGGHNTDDAIHTNATTVAEWEKFNLFRCGDFGSGSTYGVQAWGGNVINPWLTASGGGRFPGPNALTALGGPPYMISWTLLKQSDGSYAFQTASGGILTAINGGLVGGGFRTDTEMDQIGNWEKFTLIDNGDCTYYIKTYAGTYLTASNAPPDDLIITVPDMSKATRWRFWVFSL